MTRNITTITQTILGPGHVMEDMSPLPVKIQDEQFTTKPVAETELIDTEKIDPQSK